MKIFLDIGHPAHVHYFRRFIKLMEARGHRFFITARDRGVVFELLRAFDIPFVSRGKGSNTLPGKLLYLLPAAWHQYRQARSFAPDLFIDFSTVYSGPAARLMGKPYLTFTDTEHTGLYRRLIKPFCTAVYTPHCFAGDLGPRHFRFNGLMEMASLKDFKPNAKVVQAAGLKTGEMFTLVRFVQWNAVHDKGNHGFSDARKVELVWQLSTAGKVLISAEGALPAQLEPFRLKLPAHLMHPLLYEASLVVSEGATTAAEATLLGTPAIYLSSLMPGYLPYLKRKLAHLFVFDGSYPQQQAAIENAKRLLANPAGKHEARGRARQFIERHEDVTEFMMQAVEEAK